MLSVGLKLTSTQLIKNDIAPTVCVKWTLHVYVIVTFLNTGVNLTAKLWVLDGLGRFIVWCVHNQWTVCDFPTIIFLTCLRRLCAGGSRHKLILLMWFNQLWFKRMKVLLWLWNFLIEEWHPPPPNHKLPPTPLLNPHFHTDINVKWNKSQLRLQLLIKVRGKLYYG